MENVFYSICGLGYKDNCVTDTECLLGVYATKEEAIKQFNDVVEKQSTTKTLFNGCENIDYMLIQLEEDTYTSGEAMNDILNGKENVKGYIECIDVLREAKVYSKNGSNKRAVVAILEVDDSTAESLDLGTLDYLENLVDATGHIDILDARIIDDDDPWDAEMKKLTAKLFNN